MWSHGFVSQDAVDFVDAHTTLEWYPLVSLLIIVAVVSVTRNSTEFRLWL